MVVALHNIKDVHRFVCHEIHQSGLRLATQDFEELVAEGLLIMVRLAGSYDPAKDTGAGAGFHGYAKYLLRRKLSDAYHRLHPEFVAHIDENGKRVYDYRDAPDSLDDVLGQSKRRADDSDLIGDAFLDALDSDRTRTVGNFAS